MHRLSRASLLAVGIAAAFIGCKSLNTDLGKNVYERELEDTFSDAPAGVVGTTPSTRLTVFREHSFVSEPRPEGEILHPGPDDAPSGFVARSPESSQGLRFLRESTWRLAEARANSIEGMLAARDAGMSDAAIAAMFPDSEDWEKLYRETLSMSRDAVLAELDAGSRNEEAHASVRHAELETERHLAELQAEQLRLELEMHQAELETQRHMANLEADVERERMRLNHDEDLAQAELELAREELAAKTKLQFAELELKEDLAEEELEAKLALEHLWAEQEQARLEYELAIAELEQGDLIAWEIADHDEWEGTWEEACEVAYDEACDLPCETECETACDEVVIEECWDEDATLDCEFVIEDAVECGVPCEPANCELIECEPIECEVEIEWSECEEISACEEQATCDEAATCETPDAIACGIEVTCEVDLTECGPSDCGPTDCGPTDCGPTDCGPTDCKPTDCEPAAACEGDAFADSWCEADAVEELSALGYLDIEAYEGGEVQVWIEKIETEDGEVWVEVVATTEAGDCDSLDAGACDAAPTCDEAKACDEAKSCDADAEGSSKRWPYLAPAPKACPSDATEDCAPEPECEEPKSDCAPKADCEEPKSDCTPEPACEETKADCTPEPACEEAKADCEPADCGSACGDGGSCGAPAEPVACETVAAVIEVPTAEEWVALSPVPGSTASTVVPVSLASVELTPVALEPEPQDRFDGTPVMFPKSAAWKISYANADLAGETVELTVTCLDEPDKKGGPDSLSATYQVELNKKGKGSLKARLPEGWRLVRLDGPTAKPLFAVRL